MASSSTQKPSSSSSDPTPKRNFDVFLSFRGEDTRYNFTDHLFESLKRMGINTFRDDNLERGEEIAQKLLGAIEGSRCSIIVFSERYADSKWCLDELTKIMECKKEMGQIVLPVFYHVDPSHVRKQTEGFEKAFASHEINVDKEKVQRWRAAMTEAGYLCGWHVVKDYGYESKLIKEITTTIANRISNCKLLFVGDDLVGMDSHLKKISLRLSMESNDVHMIGICGMGGIGKTTIAGYVYNQFSRGFECSSFLEEVGEVYKNKGLLYLQNQLLNDIQVGGNQNTNSFRRGANVIKNSNRSQKALIVFDDVDDIDQLKFLVGNHDWYGKGSRIIITTRDRRLLTILKVDYLYEVEGLNSKEALKLFSQYAFLPNVPKEDYENLLDLVIDYCQGLPLALKVLGSLLCDKTVDEWRSELDNLEKEPKRKIQNVLKRSFYGLDRTTTKIFLDIACFFKGEDKDFASKILDGCDLHSASGIQVLQERCLISILHNRIYMHNLIQQMAWEIVREQHPEDPSKWNRLWNGDDIYHAFISEKGMKDVETISLDLSTSKERWFTTKIFAHMKKTFAKMKKLRLLKVYYSHGYTHEYKMPLPEDFEFPSNLRYLHWECLKSLPSNFHGENLVAINLKSSNIKELLEGEKHFAELKFLDLSNSHKLKKMPKFSSMPKLEILNLKGCTSFRILHLSVGAFHEMKFLTELNFSGTRIKELPSSIGYLEFLTCLNLSGCSNFEKFPEIQGNMKCLKSLYLQNSAIKELPSSIGYLESLECLNLSSCSNFEKFPEIRGNMKCLKFLYLENSAIKELPSSIGYLESLEFLNLSDCSNFEKFPEIQRNMKCLKTLRLDNSAIKELPSSIGYLESLDFLNLSGCSNFEKFPEIQGNMKCLEYFYLCNTAIKELPSSIGYLESLRSLNLSGCSNFEKFPEIQGNMKCLEYLNLHNTAIKELPSSIGYLESLFLLDLSGCSNFEKFPEIQGNMKCLEHLNLHNTAIKELPSSIGYLESLRYLNLSGCSNFEKFPEIQGNMKCLKSLYLENTAIKELPSSIGYLESLKILDLSRCSNFEKFPEIQGNMKCLKSLYLQNSAIKELPSSIGYLESLERLNLSCCSNFEKFPEIQGNMKCLKSLSLENSAIRELPSSIGYLESLECLNLSGCSNFEKFPEIQGNMKCLVSLHLENSAIKELPSSIGYLESLEFLNLSSCSNFEKFPEIQGNMKCLEYFYLCNTAIKELPSSIGYLESLRSLNLSGCSNFEKFPEIQGNMKCLEYLNLQNTAIKELPSSIGYLESLRYLNLSGCSNFEKFPEIQGNMKCLEDLNLQNTAIKELPSSIGYLESLRSLNLSGCSNFEKFPEIQGNMKCLQYLHLDKTAIKELPSSIGYSESLRYLNLSGCSNFEKFPEIQGNMKCLKHLNLDNIAIKELPNSIGCLKAL